MILISDSLRKNREYLSFSSPLIGTSNHDVLIVYLVIVDHKQVHLRPVSFSCHLQKGHPGGLGHENVDGE